MELSFLLSRHPLSRKLSIFALVFWYLELKCMLVPGQGGTDYWAEAHPWPPLGGSVITHLLSPRSWAWEGAAGDTLSMWAGLNVALIRGGDVCVAWDFGPAAAILYGIWKASDCNPVPHPVPVLGEAWGWPGPPLQGHSHEIWAVSSPRGVSGPPSESSLV